MLTNQRRVYVDQSERRSSTLDQSEPSSQNAMRGTPPIPFSDTVPAPRLFVHESWKSYYTVWSLAKTRLLRLETRSGVTISPGCNPGVLYGGAT